MNENLLPAAQAIRERFGGESHEYAGETWLTVSAPRARGPRRSSTLPKSSVSIGVGIPPDERAPLTAKVSPACGGRIRIG